MLERPHRRLNALTGEWVLVSPQRGARPWLGQVEPAAPELLPQYDPTCYLCPGNERAGGQRNPPYTGAYVFDNDFAALMPLPDSPEAPTASSPLFLAEPEGGLCRVVCFSPRHDLSLPELSQPAVEAVVETWTAQTHDLGRRPEIKYVQVFENKGAQMGASNPHPHSQIWASAHLPNEPAKELSAQARYLNEHGRCLLCDYGKAELEAPDASRRLVMFNEHWLVMVPFWAVWPFETMLISRRHAASLGDLSAPEKSGLAYALRGLTARYDNLFQVSFPYSMGLHQAPSDGAAHPSWHLHAHFYPPLFRSAAIRKFMVGYELLAMPQRDLTPESAAERLRALSETHFRQG